MSKHLLAYSAVFPIILRAEGGCTKILLHRRQNTGYMDGMWDFAGSGRVDEGETAISALIRECKEEIGIDIKTEDLSFAHLSHRLSNRTYYDVYFVVNKFKGAPRIMEPEKCAELAWFDVNNLPDSFIQCRRSAFQCYQNNILYSETTEA